MDAEWKPISADLALPREVLLWLERLTLMSVEPEYLHGIALFNQGKFFDAHEALEDVWRTAPIEEKKIWQGLVQVAVALHHHSTGNYIGMRSVLLRAMKNLAQHPREFHGIRVSILLKSLEQWLEAFDNNGRLTQLPQIHVSKNDG